MYRRINKNPNIFDIDRIEQKTEVDFPGMWDSLIWDFLCRLKNNNIDTITTWEDFDHISILGEGGFGKVILSKHIEKDKYIALKIISKENIIKLKQIHLAYNEKHILSLCKFKFILNLLTAFQTNDNLCLCLELAPGGDLYKLILEHAPLDLQTTRFYSGQIILGLQYLHLMQIVYRDLKPENVLIAANGYLKIADMGFAKILNDNPRTYTFCGTPEYIAPEIILNKGYGVAVDWWSLGILLYEFIVGHTPFSRKDSMLTFKSIVKGKYKLPSSSTSDIKNLIKFLLQSDTSKRIGNLRNGALDIRYHQFFKLLHWPDLMEQKVPPPFPTNNPDYSTFDKDKNVVDLKGSSETMRYPSEFRKF